MSSDGCAEVAWKGNAFPYLNMPPSTSQNYGSLRAEAPHAPRSKPDHEPKASSDTMTKAGTGTWNGPAPRGFGGAQQQATTLQSKAPEPTHVTLSTGARMPLVGLGTYAVDSADTIRHALAAGYRSFDCASMYGNEALVGDALAAFSGKREELFITSKVWQDAHRPDAVRASCECSIAQLQCSYLDLYMVHWPEAWRPGTTEPDTEVTFEDTWRAMESLVDAGLVRALGVCNVDLATLEALLAAARVKPAVLQVELHPLLAQRKLVGVAYRKGVQCVAYSPLAKGSAELLAAPQVVRVAREVGKTPAQVVLRWGVQRGVPVLPKAAGAARLGENVDVLTWGLSYEQKALLDTLDSGRRFVSPSWHQWADPEEGGAGKASRLM